MVSGTRGLVLHATGQLDPSKPGYVIVPGASGPIDGDPDDVDTIPVLLARFGETAAVPLMRQAMANPDVTVATVCGGSLALAMAGLIEGRNAVTHVLGLDVLEATGVNVVRARVVDDGDLVTAGGVTSVSTSPCICWTEAMDRGVAMAVEELFEYERRGTVWTDRRMGCGDQDTHRIPAGSLHVHQRLGRTGGHAQPARARQSRCAIVTVAAQRVTWKQSVTKPMRLNLEFDVVVDGDRLTGHSRAGRLPRSAVTGVRC